MRDLFSAFGVTFLLTRGAVATPVVFGMLAPRQGRTRRQLRLRQQSMPRQKSRSLVRPCKVRTQTTHRQTSILLDKSPSAMHIMPITPTISRDSSIKSRTIVSHWILSFSSRTDRRCSIGKLFVGKASPKGPGMPNVIQASRHFLNAFSSSCLLFIRSAVS